MTLWGVASREPETTIETRTQQILSLAFPTGGSHQPAAASADAGSSASGSRLLVTGGIDGAVNVVDVESGTVVRSIEAHSAPCRSVILSADGNQVISGGDDMRIRVFDTRAGTAVNTFTGHRSWVLSLATNHSVGGGSSGQYLVSGSADRTVKVWDLAMKEHLQSIEGFADQVWGVAFAPEAASDGGERFAAGCEDGTLRFYTATSTANI